MEFSHPCFQKGHPYLLEHIKRKIAHPKVPETKDNVKVEAVNRMLNEVKTMRGRQDALDTRFSSMKQENEALWRELAILRQKHLKQQQIVNKVRDTFFYAFSQRICIQDSIFRYQFVHKQNSGYIFSESVFLISKIFIRGIIFNFPTVI